MKRVVLLGVLGSMSFAAAACSAQPYEPNNSILEAAGPVTIGQTVTAGAETAGDRDFYFFYATSPGETEVALLVKNLGGGTEVSSLGATILDSSGTPMKAVGFIGKGEERTLAIALEPQKYFVEIAPNEGFGDSYALSPSDGSGGFGPFSQIARRCARAAADFRRARATVDRARGRLQRATGRLRRARFSSGEVRRAARSDLRTARAALAKKTKTLRVAASAKKPWCSISS
jgi:hypothetical protein